MIIIFKHKEHTEPHLCVPISYNMYLFYVLRVLQT